LPQLETKTHVSPTILKGQSIPFTSI
jgi:hypothetical protein